MAGQRSIDAILALRLMSEIHRAFHQPLHVAHVDFRTAFDSVDRNALWKALAGAGLPTILRNLIQNLHGDTMNRIIRVADLVFALPKFSINVRSQASMYPGFISLLPRDGTHNGVDY